MLFIFMGFKLRSNPSTLSHRGAAFKKKTLPPNLSMSLESALVFACNGFIALMIFQTGIQLYVKF